MRRLQGWLHKRGLKNIAFRKRWVVLEDGRARYYKQRNGPKSVPKGEFQLRGAAVYPLPDASAGRWGFQSKRAVLSLCVVQRLLSRASPRPHNLAMRHLTVQLPERTYHVEAETEWEREQWMTAFNVAVAALESASTPHASKAREPVSISTTRQPPPRNSSSSPRGSALRWSLKDLPKVPNGTVWSCLLHAASLRPTDGCYPATTRYDAATHRVPHCTRLPATASATASTIPHRLLNHSASSSYSFRAVASTATCPPRPMQADHAVQVAQGQRTAPRLLG